ncbi:unnamed protein product [Ilex paraguariensis]|uniref:Uncharacterized protein n=1 Tax=Ilex paraguariensis TaxID=185542 RepID=A0ABC8SI46_9AQUA
MEAPSVMDLPRLVPPRPGLVPRLASPKPSLTLASPRSSPTPSAPCGLTPTYPSLSLVLPESLEAIWTAVPYRTPSTTQQFASVAQCLIVTHLFVAIIANLTQTSTKSSNPSPSDVAN